jgi:hypothetical protein
VLRELDFRMLKLESQLDIQCPRSWIISKNRTRLSPIITLNKKIKKAVLNRRLGNDNAMDDKQKALALLDKYVKVLSEIEGHQDGVKESRSTQHALWTRWKNN